jgi:hypothetical protein
MIFIPNPLMEVSNPPRSKHDACAATEILTPREEFLLIVPGKILFAHTTTFLMSGSKLQSSKTGMDMYYPRAHLQI